MVSRVVSAGALGGVEHLARNVGARADGDERAGDVDGVAVGVRLVGVAEYPGGLAVERGSDDHVAERGQGDAAWAELVGGSHGRDVAVAGRGVLGQLVGHLLAYGALPGVGPVGRGFGHRLAVGVAQTRSAYRHSAAGGHVPAGDEPDRRGTG